MFHKFDNFYVTFVISFFHEEPHNWVRTAFTPMMQIYGNYVILRKFNITYDTPSTIGKKFMRKIVQFGLKVNR